VEWDAKDLKATNAPDAEPLVRPTYRKGYSAYALVSGADCPHRGRGWLIRPDEPVDPGFRSLLSEGPAGP
jgi:hypothetical protein